MSGDTPVQNNDSATNGLQKFYYCADGSKIDRLLKEVPILISAATLWKKGSFNLPANLDGASEIFLDSGGFSFFTKWEKYPFSPEEYVNFILRFKDRYPQLKYVAVMDYPCENFVNRKSLKTNRQRIGATIQNTKELLSFEIPASWVSVVQGYSYSDYRYCCELMEEQELFTTLTAVGSICTRKKLSEISTILRIVKQFTDKIHAFGLEYQVIKTRSIWDLLYSCDSGAWKFTSRNHKERGFKGFWRPRNHQDKINNLAVYQNKIGALFLDRGVDQERWVNLSVSIDGMGSELQELHP